MKPELLRQLLLYRYRYIVAYVALVGVALSALIINLGGSLPGIANQEATSALNNFTLASIFDSPINAPYKLLQYSSLHLFGGSAWAVRLPSVIFGALFLVALFSAITLWHKHQIAILATLFAASSSWFLHWARFGSDIIVLPTMAMAVIVIAAWIHHGNGHFLSKLLLVLIFAVALYTPLMLPMLILFVIVYRREIAQQRKRLGRVQQYILAAIGALIMLPLIISFVGDLSLFKQWLGLPNQLPSPLDYLNQLNRTFGFLFWRAQPNGLLHLGTLPMLDIFTATMTALGLYHYEQHSNHLRSRYIIIGALLALLVASFNNDQAANGLLMPFTFIFAATGVITLITQWNNIFPRNPVARLSAIIPLTLLIFTVVMYHTQRYFIAWPNHITTHNLYPADSTLLSKDISTETQAYEEILVIAQKESLERLRTSMLGVDRNVLIISPQIIDNQSLESYSTLYIANEIRTTALVGDIGEPLRYVASDSVRQPIEFDVYDLSALR